MSRNVITFAGVVLLSVGCLAQGSETNRSQETGRSGKNQGPSIGVRSSSQQTTEGSISVARLRAPLKVRRLYEKARTAFWKHQYAEAQGKLTQALQLYPAFPEALTLSAAIQLDLNQWEPAERSLQAAVQSDPTYGTAYVVLGDLYNRELRFDDALSVSERAVALTDSWVVQYEMARALIGKGQYGLALSTSDAALRANPGTLLHVAEAHALVGLARYAEAAAELRTYLEHQSAGQGCEDARDLLQQIQSVTGQ